MGRHGDQARVTAVATTLCPGQSSWEAWSKGFVSSDRQAAIAGSKLVILPSAAHLSNVEQAERFNQTVLDFLKSL